MRPPTRCCARCVRAAADRRRPRASRAAAPRPTRPAGRAAGSAGSASHSSTTTRQSGLLPGRCGGSGARSGGRSIAPSQDTMVPSTPRTGKHRRGDRLPAEVGADRRHPAFEPRVHDPRRGDAGRRTAARPGSRADPARPTGPVITTRAVPASGRDSSAVRCGQHLDEVALHDRRQRQSVERVRLVPRDREPDERPERRARVERDVDEPQPALGRRTPAGSRAR